MQKILLFNNNYFFYLSFLLIIKTTLLLLLFLLLLFFLMSQQATFSSEYFIEDNLPPDIGLVKRGYVIPNDKDNYGCFYAIKHDEDIGSGGVCAYPRAKINNVKDSVLTAERVLDRMDCYYNRNNMGENKLFSEFGKEKWKKYIISNGLVWGKTPEKVYVTIVTKAAFPGNDPNDLTPVEALYFLSCKGVSREDNYTPKESFFLYHSLNSDCAYSDCNNDGGCHPHSGAKVVEGKDCRKCPGHRLCGLAWQSRYFCCKQTSIKTKEISGLQNLKGRGCYSFLVDLRLGAMGTYCFFPRKTTDCQLEPVSMIKPEVCFPSNQRFGTPDSSDCKRFIDVEISKAERDNQFEKICSHYRDQDLVACSCVNAPYLDEFKELKKLPTFQGQVIGCFWHQCQDTTGAVFVSEDDRPRECNSINCINWIELEGLTQNQIDSLNQNVVCDIDTGGGGDDDDDNDNGNVTPVPIVTSRPPVFQDSGDKTSSSTESPGAWYEFDFLGPNTFYIIIGVGSLIAFLVVAYFFFMNFKSSSETPPNTPKTDQTNKK